MTGSNSTPSTRTRRTGRFAAEASHADLPAGVSLLQPWHAWAFIYRSRQYYAWLRQRFGDLATLRAPHTTILMALTVEGAREVLTGNPDSYAAFQKEAFRGLAGDGSLFVLDGARHRHERQLLAPKFHAQHVRGYGQAIQENVRSHLGGWIQGQEIRAHEAMLGITRDVILRVVFGQRSTQFMGEARRVLEDTLSAAHPLLEYLPPFQSWWFPPWRKFVRAKREFSAFIARVMAQRRGDGDVDSEDVLSLLMGATKSDGTPLSDAEIRDELYTILLPGHATTAVALAWALYELGQHPDVMCRVRQELAGLGTDPDPLVIAKLPLLGAVCNETMRRHPIVTEIARLTLTPCELLGHQIPAGVGLGVGIAAIHQDPAIYPDPNRFLPERFFERDFTPYEFLPFGGGHRRCLGAALSDFEMRITLATIVSQWEYTLTSKERERRHNLATGPQHGVRMRLVSMGAQV